MTAFSRPALSRSSSSSTPRCMPRFSGFSRLTSRVFLESRDLRPRRQSRWCWPPATAGALSGGPSGRPPGRSARCPQGHPLPLLNRGGVDRTGVSAGAGLWLLFAVGVFHSAALAPLAPLSDTLALGAAAAARSDDTVRRGFEYGWVRGAGSAAFILGSMLSGQAVEYFGIASVVWLNAALLATVAFAALLVPQLPPTQDAARATEAKGGVSVGLERCCGCRSTAGSFWSRH